MLIKRISESCGVDTGAWGFLVLSPLRQHPGRSVDRKIGSGQECRRLSTSPENQNVHEVTAQYQPVVYASSKPSFAPLHIGRSSAG